MKQIALSCLFAGSAVLVANCLSGGATAAERPVRKPAIRVDLPCQAELRSPVVHDVDFRVVVTPPAGCRSLKVWLPLPPSSAAQQISGSKLSTFPDRVAPRIATEPKFGNRFAYFEFRSPRGAQIIRHRFRAKVWESRWGVEPAKVVDVASWPKSFDSYLKPHEISKRPEFRRLMAGIVPASRGMGHDVISVMNWIGGNLKYDHSRASLTADAANAFENRAGHCSDFHGLCATMARSLGHPSRVTYGLALYPKNSPSHCKLEAFLPPYGWVNFDLSETKNLLGRIERNSRLTAARKEKLKQAARLRLRRGFRENCWLLVTRGTNYELAPRAAGPVGVVRTVYAEADGKPLPDPDPADRKKLAHAWMTSHRYQSDRPFQRPFHDIETLTTRAGP